MSKSVEEIAEEIADWAIDEKLTPIKKRCADMITEALTAERKRAEDAEAENKRLRGALIHMKDCPWKHSSESTIKNFPECLKANKALTALNESEKENK